MRYLAAVRLFILDGLWQERSRNIKGQQNCTKFVQCVWCRYVMLIAKLFEYES